jgi:hypothetical protein
MSTYASLADFAQYAEAPTDYSADAKQRALDAAELDVDTFLPGAVDPTSGLRLDVAALPVWQLERLIRAVVAQAEYRLEMGPEFFSHASNDEVIQGPDFTISGRRSRFSVSAAAFLRGAGLLLGGARAVP